MTWVILLPEVLAGAGLIGVGLLLARPVNSASGLLLAAAGGLVTIGGFCLLGIRRLPASGYDEAMVLRSVSTLGSGCVDLVVVGLITAAALTLAKGFKERGLG